MDYKDLAGLLRSKMTEDNLSTYEIARRSGGKINANTITRILNGDVREAKLSTLEAIATALEMPVNDVVNAAQGKTGDIYETYAERFDAADLSKSEWQYLENFFREHIDHYRRQREKLDAGEFVKSETKKGK